MTEPVNVCVNPATETASCARCAGCRYRFPLTGLALSGVYDLGMVELCPQCDSVSAVVARWREAAA